MKKGVLLCVGMLVPVLGGTRTGSGDEGTSRITAIHGAAPAESARITKYYVDKALPNSGYETGSLHILYSDNVEVVEALPAKQKGSEKEVVENQEGIADVKMAENERTIGWAETFDNCCTSYSIPMALAIYGSGKTVLHIQQGQMLWYWTFEKGGKQVVTVWGATHGPEVGDYQLYDTKTGKMLAEVSSDEQTQALKADAPEWAKRSEEAMRHQN